MICWSCEKDVGAGGVAFCPACRAVLPPVAQVDHFALLGLARLYDVDLADVENRYKTLTKKLHPDRFARADARARRASLAWSVALNDAWRTLRDPVRRAEYLLGLFGVEVGAEEGMQEGTSEGTRERVLVPQALLMEVLERREALAEAVESDDQEAIAVLSKQVQGERERALQQVATAFAAEPVDLVRAAEALVEVRYLDRFVEEAATHRGADSEDGVAHGG